MRSCDEMTELLSAFLDGELTVDERRELDEHLASCPACGALLAELRGLSEATGALSQAPEGFVGQVMERIRAEDAPKTDNVTPLPTKRSKPVRWKGWTATAAVAAVVILGVCVLPGRIGLTSADSSTAGYISDAENPLNIPELDGLNSPAVIPGTAPESDRSSVPDGSDAAKSTNGNPGGATAPVRPASLPAEDTAPGTGERDIPSPTAAPTLYCGVLLLTGESLPEELASLDATVDETGRPAYKVPSDVFFAIAEALEAQNGSNFSRLDEGNIDPAAPYGLILVDQPAE